MTRRNAERITGLGCTTRQIGNYWMAYLGNPTSASGQGKTENLAVKDAVEARYHQVGDTVRLEQGFLCFVCGRISLLQTDHIKPRARGQRDDTRMNLRAVCPEDHQKITDNILKDPPPHELVALSMKTYGWQWGGDRWVRCTEVDA